MKRKLTKMLIMLQIAFYFSNEWGNTRDLFVSFKSGYNYTKYTQGIIKENASGATSDKDKCIPSDQSYNITL